MVFAIQFGPFWGCCRFVVVMSCVVCCVVGCVCVCVCVCVFACGFFVTAFSFVVVALFGWLLGGVLWFGSLGLFWIGGFWASFGVSMFSVSSLFCSPSLGVYSWVRFPFPSVLFFSRFSFFVFVVYGEWRELGHERGQCHNVTVIDWQQQQR